MLRRILAIGGSVLALGAFGAGAASADTEPDGTRVTGGEIGAMASCEGGHLCMWEDRDYLGDKWVDVVVGGCTNNACDIDGWNGDNEISSIRNYTGCDLVLYADDGFGGRSGSYGRAETDIPNLELTGFDNDAESFKLNC